MNVNAPIAPHPGAYLKDLLKRKRISVTKAAGLLGVGRPALSNVLNASAALTPDMALRLEKAFQESAESLMAMQTAFDQWENRDNAKEMAVRTFVEDFLRIEARQIAAWADQMPARAELAAFLRRLVHSTGKALSKVDFPAYDNSQRQGWDGTVVTDEATPWIPRGASGWEFGVDKIPAAKADSDYAARTSSVPADERAAMTFVFVTPRNWTGKEAWAKARRAAGEWKDVRAFDANDLEQWL